MDLESYKKLVEELDDKIGKKRNSIRILFFIALFIVLFILANKYSWAETLGWKFALAFIYTCYPGFMLWAPWDFNWILQYFKSYRELLQKIKSYKEEIKKIEETNKVVKNKEGIEKLERLRTVYSEIFNRRISVESLEEYEEFISIDKDLSTNNYYFDYETRRKYELLHKYSKQLQERIINFNQDKRIGVVKTFIGIKNENISNESDVKINFNAEQKVRLVNIESFKNKYKQYKIRDGKEDWRSGRKIKIDYLKKNLQNINLGLQGELIVLDWERDNLIQCGLNNLAEKVRHISQELGDGVGFDILSYDENGNEKFIEVKTTKSGMNTQFYYSEGELNFINNTQNYYLYRLNLENEDEAELTIISKDEFLNKFEVLPYQYSVKFKNE
ncbi:MAG: DUF3883 domain-containing protein [Patescibacteria group bacterium]